jgi:TolA-binding protein
MNKSILLAFIAIYLHNINLYSAEPSAFGAGDVSRPSPYGLTPKEKLLLQNKKEIKRVIIQSNNQNNTLKEKIVGLQSILDSINKNAHSNKIKLNNLNEVITKNLQNTNLYEIRLSKLVQTNTTQIEKINLLNNELAKIVDKINTSYVEKKEFNKLVDDVNKFKILVLKELKSNAKPKVNDFSKMSNMKIEKKAKALYTKRNFTKALKYYEYLIDKKYKPAKDYYMIGEIYYFKKNYANAIAYFKKSVSTNANASYMPFLMLHAAISMEKTGDKINAKKFYSALIIKYPDSSSAIIAQKKINKTK